MDQWTESTFILKPSLVAGIGVFATHPIKAGTEVFKDNYSPRVLKTKDIPKAFQKYCIFLNDEESLCPERFDRMEVEWFLNHSKDPNLSKTPDEKIIALKDIQAGDEVFIDYNQLNEPEHLKESYYK